MKKISKIFIKNGWIELSDKNYEFLTSYNSEEMKNNILLNKEFEKIIILKDIVLNKVGELLYLSNPKSTWKVYLYKSYINKVVKEENVIFQKEVLKKNTLCGNKFIGEYLVMTDPEDLAYGEVLERKCSNCFFKPIPTNLTECNIMVGSGNMRPSTLFRRKKNEGMTSKIDGKDVAQYCKYFAHPDLE